MNHPPQRAFTLIELLVVIAIISILAALLLPCLAKTKNRARMIEETSAGRQLMLAVQMHADDHDGEIFPGYVTDTSAVDDQGQPLNFPENARYPWRIVPYLSGSMPLIYSGENRAKLIQMQSQSHADYVYSVSVFPSLGINSYFIGGKLRSLSKSAQAVSSTRWEWLALLGVGFLTVYREGFEMALFLQSLLLEGSKSAVIIGSGVAVGFLLLIGTLTFRYGVKLPYRKLLVLTGVLVVSIMVTFIGSTVRLFQTVNWMPIHPVYSLHLPNWSGLWLGLYPSWEGLLIPPLALVYVGGMWLFNRWRSHKTESELSSAETART